MIAPSKSGPGSSQSPKLGGKSPTDERPLKPPGIMKQSSSSKSPSYASKSNTGVGRVGTASKKDPKPRPTTPHFEGKGFATPSLSKTSPKTPTSTVPDAKLKSTLNKIQETAAATTKGIELPKQRPGPMGRSSVGSKSPGRSGTPPQGKSNFSINPQVHLRNDSTTLQALLKSTKSSSHTSAQVTGNTVG